MQDFVHQPYCVWGFRFTAPLLALLLTLLKGTLLRGSISPRAPLILTSTAQGFFSRKPTLSESAFTRTPLPGKPVEVFAVSLSPKPSTPNP